VPVFGPAGPHLGPNALGVPVAPFGHRDGRRTIDEQVGFGADLEQLGIVIRDERRPALEIGLAAAAGISGESHQESPRPTLSLKAHRPWCRGCGLAVTA
jgi:hypothetical protein